MLRIAGFLLVLLLTGPAQAETMSGTAHVVDGDTIDVAGHRVRIHGIDAPEGKQVCHDAKGDRWEAGKDATEALRSIIGQQTVTCTEEDRPDRYKRMIASCRAGKIDIGAEMVRLGWARAFVRYSDRYTGQEDAARRAKRGMWAGMCEAPWDWRLGHR
jgi:endonuclease YncB( thermonuclease family)